MTIPITIDTIYLIVLVNTMEEMTRIKEVLTVQFKLLKYISHYLGITIEKNED